MLYLVELVIKFPINWNLIFKTFFFEIFSKKKMMQPLIKYAKFGQKINFPKSNRGR